MNKLLLEQNQAKKTELAEEACNTFRNTVFYIKAMGITLSTHTKERAEERGISEDGIKAILQAALPQPYLAKQTPKRLLCLAGTEAKSGAWCLISIP